MKFRNLSSELFVPDNQPEEKALQRTTMMGIVAHQDDLEIGMYHGILKCFESDKDWFAGVVVTNGAGSPRDGIYAKYTDEEMQKVRRVEQKKAATVGRYSCQVFLDYPSSAMKDAKNQNPKQDIVELVKAAKPSTIYTHNLADKHDTHVAVALRTIQALRELPAAMRPQAVYGCEVWRDLDWMLDEDKKVFDVSSHENLGMALTSIFDSQVSGGKRYDLASQGRRRAHATYFASHGVDTATGLIFGMDLTPLVKDPALDIKKFVSSFIDRFSQEVDARLGKLL